MSVFRLKITWYISKTLISGFKLLPSIVISFKVDSSKSGSNECVTRTHTHKKKKKMQKPPYWLYWNKEEISQQNQLSKRVTDIRWGSGVATRRHVSRHGNAMTLTGCYGCSFHGNPSKGMNERGSGETYGKWGPGGDA